ncbi:MAG: M48 family metallopeptidase [Planctomycetota bacterium]
MGYLLHILAAVLVQGLAEMGWTTGWSWPWAVPLLAVVPHALIWGSRRAFLAGRFRSSSMLLRISAGSAPILHLVALCAFGWMQSVEGWLGVEISLDAWPRVAMLLSLAPFVLYETAAIDARARSIASSGRDRASWRVFQIRMLFSALAPFAAYLLLMSAVGASRTLQVEIEQVSLFGAAFAGAMLLGLALLLPTLLRNVWDTSPIPPGLQRDVLTSVAVQAGFRARALLSWNTGDLMANAAIVGIGPRTRIVLFSDSLLTQLDLRELAAVFAHEIGHAVRRHVLHFVVWAAGFLLLADVVANRFLADNGWLAGGFFLAAVAAWLLVFGYVSRRFELEADLYCLELLGDTSALIAALEKVGGHFRDVASWRHFSTADRVRFLTQVTTDPAHGARLRASLGRWKRLGTILLVLALSLQAWTLAATFRDDRVRADLLLGRYASAAERAENADGLDPELVRLAKQAASLGDGIPVSELEIRARRSLASGDAEAGLGWLELGAIRGDAELERVALAVQALASGGPEPGNLLGTSELESWKAEIEAIRRRLPKTGDPEAPKRR